MMQCFWYLIGRYCTTTPNPIKTRIFIYILPPQIYKKYKRLLLMPQKYTKNTKDFLLYIQKRLFIEYGINRTVR